MRNQKTIKLNPSLTVTILELSVEDVISFLSAMGDELDDDQLIKNYLKKNPTDMLERASKLVFFNKPEKFKELIKKHQDPISEIFFEVNAEYFGKVEVDPKRKLKHAPKRCSFLVKKLRRVAEVLIREGHTDVFSYGWAFFSQSMAFQDELVKESNKK